MSSTTGTRRPKSLRQRIREPVEQSLGVIRGKDGPVNISGGGYRLVQALADRIKGDASRDQEELKEPTSTRHGVNPLIETQLILQTALKVVQEDLAIANASR